MAGEAGRDVRAGCQVVVVGDHGAGKSSLIIALATDSFPEKPPPVLPPTRLPPDFYPDRVPLTIVDTSSRFPLPFPCFRSLCRPSFWLRSSLAREVKRLELIFASFCGFGVIRVGQVAQLFVVVIEEVVEALFCVEVSLTLALWFWWRIGKRTRLRWRWSARKRML
jgi:hypothetical protein